MDSITELKPQEKELYNISAGDHMFYGYYYIEGKNYQRILSSGGDCFQNVRLIYANDIKTNSKINFEKSIEDYLKIKMRIIFNRKNCIFNNQQELEKILKRFKRAGFIFNYIGLVNGDDENIKTMNNLIVSKPYMNIHDLLKTNDQYHIFEMNIKDYTNTMYEPYFALCMIRQLFMPSRFGYKFTEALEKIDHLYPQLDEMEKLLWSEYLQQTSDVEDFYNGDYKAFYASHMLMPINKKQYIKNKLYIYGSLCMGTFNDKIILSISQNMLTQLSINYYIKYKKHFDQDEFIKLNKKYHCIYFYNQPRAYNSYGIISKYIHDALNNGKSLNNIKKYIKDTSQSSIKMAYLCGNQISPIVTKKNLQLIPLSILKSTPIPPDRKDTIIKSMEEKLGRTPNLYAMNEWLNYAINYRGIHQYIYDNPRHRLVKLTIDNPRKTIMCGAVEYSSYIKINDEKIAFLETMKMLSE